MIPRLRRRGLIEACGPSSRASISTSIPRLRRRGLIEAQKKKLFVVTRLLIPRLRRRGLIEAIKHAVNESDVRRFRVFADAASLKP